MRIDAPKRPRFEQEALPRRRVAVTYGCVPSIKVVASASVLLAIACSGSAIRDPASTSPNQISASPATDKNQAHDPKLPGEAQSELDGDLAEQGAGFSMPESTATRPSVSSDDQSDAISKRDARVTGILKKEEIKRAIHKDANLVRECIDDGVKRGFVVRDRIDVRFVIGVGGKVTKVDIVNDGSGDRAVDACLVDAVRRFQFPPPRGDGEVVVTYPLIIQFSPRSSHASRDAGFP